MQKSLKLGVTLLLVVLMVVTVASGVWAETVTLTLYDRTNINRKVLETVKVKFEAANPNIKVELPYGAYRDPEERFQHVATSLQNGDYDLAFLSTYELDAHVLAGNLASVDGFLRRERQRITNELGLVQDQLRYNGRVFDIPVVIAPNVVVYNTDLFAEAGLSYPAGSWTWYDLSLAAKRINSPSIVHPRFGAVSGFGLSTLWPVMAQQSAPTLLQSDASTLKRAFDQLLFTDTLKAWYPLSDRRYSFNNSFRRGEIGMFVDDFNVCLGNVLPMPTASGTAKSNFGIVNLPKLEDTTADYVPAEVTSIGIGVGSRHPAEAWKLIQFMTGSEGAEIIAGSGHVPAFNGRDAMRQWGTLLTDQIATTGLEHLFAGTYTNQYPRAHSEESRELKHLMKEKVNQVLARQTTQREALDAVLLMLKQMQSRSWPEP